VSNIILQIIFIGMEVAIVISCRHQIFYKYNIKQIVKDIFNQKATRSTIMNIYF